MFARHGRGAAPDMAGEHIIPAVLPAPHGIPSSLFLPPHPFSRLFARPFEPVKKI